MLLPHCYRIEEDYFFAMCDQLGWDYTKFKTLWFITTAPPGQTRYRLCDGHIGTYNPLVKQEQCRCDFYKLGNHAMTMITPAAMTCTRCGAQRGQCSCWSKVVLRCPDCGRTKEAVNDPTDPPGTAVVEAPCDQCDHGGNKPEVHYYDAAGRWFNGEKFVTVLDGERDPVANGSEG